jgi:uncharacterized protein YgiM (DUF1202 family)
VLYFPREAELRRDGTETTKEDQMDEYPVGKRVSAVQTIELMNGQVSIGDTGEVEDTDGVWLVIKWDNGRTCWVSPKEVKTL